jgi:pyruvate,water dikinase
MKIFKKKFPGVPCIVGCHDATSKIKTGQEITLDVSEETGYVFEGHIPFDQEEVDLNKVRTLRTKVCLNVAVPEQALGLSFLPNSGVGLARMEFIVSNHIGIHPMALLKPDELDHKEFHKMQEKMKPYTDGPQFFVDKLAEGVALICAAFYPKRVILRFSDFKTNEYAGLIGGEHFEPKESNPMIGWRGASRYYNPKYSPGFALFLHLLLCYLLLFIWFSIFLIFC